MQTQWFTSHLRDFADHMDDGDFHLAYLRAMDAWAVGNALKDEIVLANERFGLDGWKGRNPQKLTDAFGDFLTGLSAACEAEASRRRSQKEREH
jgi:hypothetical protein